MNTLNTFMVIGAIPTCFAEPVATFSTDVALYFAVSGVAETILPCSLASTGRTFNGGQVVQLSLALPFHK